MARPSKTAAIDYAATHVLTHGLLERATCPDGLPFVLLKDDEKKGLRVRVTKAGGKHWQFETRIKGKLFTRALGEWPAVSIYDAREEANRLRGLTEKGTDPREIERQQFPPLELVNRPHVDTEQAAHYVMRRPQTLRAWACLENGPLRPIRINGRLAWPVSELRRVLGVA